MSRTEREFFKFDGLVISVADLKKSINRLKGIGKKGGMDLQISNDQTKEVYTDENTFYDGASEDAVSFCSQTLR